MAVALFMLPMLLLLQLVLEPAGDEDRQICEVSFAFLECHKAFHIQTEANFQAFMDSCLVVLPSMGEAVTVRLRYALRAGTLSDTVPNLVWARPSCNWDCCHAGVPWKRPEDMWDLGRDRQAYMDLGIYPMQEQKVPIRELLPALQRGGTVKFDATELLPARVFNVTVQDLANSLPAHGKHLDVYSGRGWQKDPSFRCHSWLMYFSGRLGVWGTQSLRARFTRMVFVPLLLRFSCPNPSISFKALADAAKDLYKGEIPWGAFVRRHDEAKKKMQKVGESHMLRFTSINMRRFPKFSVGVAEEFERRLGITDLVERTHSILWFGQNMGKFHQDRQDNVYIQLSASSEVMVIPANCSALAISCGVALSDSISHFIVKKSPAGSPRPCAPFYHFTLRAGEGALFPSNSYHRVVSRYNQRIALNFFLEPRFGKRQLWQHAPSHHFKAQDTDVWAMRVLWLRATKHLWDTRQISVAFHTENQDLV